MKKTLLILTFLSAHIAAASVTVQIGQYEGKLADGGPCYISLTESEISVGYKKANETWDAVSTLRNSERTVITQNDRILKLHGDLDGAALDVKAQLNKSNQIISAKIKISYLGFFSPLYPTITCNEMMQVND